MTRSLSVVPITMTGEVGNSFAYPLTYLDTCRSWAPVHEKRRMSEGELKEHDCQDSKELTEIVLSWENGCFILSSYVYVELRQDPTTVSESSFSILVPRCSRQLVEIVAWLSWEYYEDFLH